MNKKIYNLLPLLALFLFMGACEFTELEDLLDNPNNANPNNAELDLVFNEVMLDLGAFTDEVSDETMPYVRMVAMTGGNQYQNQDSPTSFSQLWNDAYSEMFPDIELVISLAEENGSTVHSGIAKTVKAYVMMTMVDLFGDIPYSEAGKGVEVPSPVADDDQSVYQAALGLLDAALADFANPVGSPDNDLFYGGDADKWIKLANSLKLRYHVMTRLAGGSAAEVNSLMDKVISSNSDDFEFQYGSNRSTPDSRHPYYADGYETGGPSWYMSNYMMWTMFGDKDTEDPRLRYYFYRQDCDETDEDQFTLDCPAAPVPAHYLSFPWPWCTASGPQGDPNDEYGGYWGRDHGNDDGIPPDDLKRTAWGLYPAGGKFDNDNCEQVSNAGTDGGRGAGIQPILLASWMDFYKAEAVLAMGANGDARALLESGVRKSIDKVMGFGSLDSPDSDFLPSQDQIDAYVDEVLARYDVANSDGKLNVVMAEFHLAAHGMGLDPFNNYRRTGMPKNMQPTRETDPGIFARLFWYPANYVNQNANASQRNIDQQVFWDTNPPGFIN